jgi:hypothetical protein
MPATDCKTDKTLSWVALRTITVLTSYFFNSN